MRKRFDIQIKPRYLFVVLFIFCVAMLVISYRFTDETAPLKRVVGDAVTPMQTGINRIGRSLADQVRYFKKLDALTEENERLKEQLSTVTYENQILLQNRYKLENFRELYELDQTYADYPKVAARVITHTTGNWDSSFMIDKGENDGIKVGMNVMAGNGLCGIITEVGKNHAMVRSIIDDTSYVSAMFLKTSDTCIVKGNLKTLNNGYIEVTDIRKGATVRDGYEVVTSYISTKYHPGILIGYVSNVEMDASNMTMSGVLTPAVDFSKLDMVLIITQEKEELD